MLIFFRTLPIWHFKVFLSFYSSPSEAGNPKVSVNINSHPVWKTFDSIFFERKQVSTIWQWPSDVIKIENLDIQSQCVDVVHQRVVVRPWDKIGVARKYKNVIVINVVGGSSDIKQIGRLNRYLFISLNLLKKVQYQQSPFEMLTPERTFSTERCLPSSEKKDYVYLIWYCGPLVLTSQ